MTDSDGQNRKQTMIKNFDKSIDVEARIHKRILHALML